MAGLISSNLASVRPSPPSHVAMALLSSAINLRLSFFTSCFSLSFKPTFFTYTNALTKFTPFFSFTILSLCIYVDILPLSSIGTRKLILQLDSFRRDQAVNGSENCT